MASSKARPFRVALPKKGRLRAPAVRLLTKAGYDFADESDLLYAPCDEAGIDFVYLRTQDIPTLVEEGAVDLGITGKDQVLEKRARIEELLPLDFGQCELALAGPLKQKISTAERIAKLKDKKIATSFPELTRRFFRQHHIQVQPLKISGSLEVMPALGLCEAIVDIVQTGRTLAANRLHVYTSIGSYYTALYAHKDRLSDPRVNLLVKRLTGALHARTYRILEYNIPKTLLPQAEKIAPGFDSPTLSHLEDSRYVAVKVLVKANEVIRVMDALEALGASGILETELKNCRL